ncbi:hypothetical protein NDU88_003640 [Pleurodeles waltl]|uniref:Uncharacterized protein n=1 Tax=Pleurodeles waltl TaxID=8319 RepID=A0AAV7V1A2_PLEWA|nr:hypothetical protein NDU88_003640 [Pleurodeles waltl]
MAVTSAAVRIITAGALHHWLLGPNAALCRGLRPPTATVHRPLGHMRRWQNPLVYRPLVDLLTMEERHLLITYRFDRATILELCT